MAGGKVTIKVDSAGTLRFFDRLHWRTKKNASRSIARAAAKPIVKKAREILHARKKSGTLKASIITKTHKKYWGVIVGPNYKNKGKDGRYGVNVAFGKVLANGRRGAKKPMGNFMIEAAESVKGEVYAGLKKGVLKVMRREIAKGR